MLDEISLDAVKRNATKRWPKKIPVLTSKDITKGCLYYQDRETGTVTSCSVGWIRRIVPPHRQDKAITEYKQMLREQGELPDTFSGFLDDISEVTSWNDSARITKAKIARMLNKFFRSKGYTEVEEVEG